jgi:hypothetical protein
MSLEQYLNRYWYSHTTPNKLNTPPEIAPTGNTITNLPVYRSPCGVAQCLALNLADAAQIEYGTYLQLHQIIESMQ